MVLCEAIVLIVLIGAVVRVILARQQTRGVMGEESAALTRSQAEIDELKQRIQVLERVITDNHGSNQLDQEIERLRDR